MLCATCEFGYYKSGEWCVECPATQWWQLTLLALVLLGFLAAFSRFATYLKGLGAPRIFFSFVTVTSTFVYFSIDWLRGRLNPKGGELACRVSSQS